MLTYLFVTLSFNQNSVSHRWPGQGIQNFQKTDGKGEVNSGASEHYILSQNVHIKDLKICANVCKSFIINKLGRTKFECSRTLHALAIRHAKRWGDTLRCLQILYVKTFQNNLILNVRRNCGSITIRFDIFLTYTTGSISYVHYNILFHARNIHIKINLTNTNHCIHHVSAVETYISKPIILTDE